MLSIGHNERWLYLVFKSIFISLFIRNINMLYCLNMEYIFLCNNQLGENHHSVLSVSFSVLWKYSYNRLLVSQYQKIAEFHVLFW